MSKKTLEALAQSKGYSIKGKGKKGKSAASESQSVVGTQGGQSNGTSKSEKRKAKAKTKAQAAAPPPPKPKAKATPALGGPDWCQRYLTLKGCDGSCGKAHVEQAVADDLVRAGRVRRKAEKAAAREAASAGPAVVAQ